MRECYWPEASVRLSWFQGRGVDFVAQSEAMASRGHTSTHRLSPPVIDLEANRAVVEVAAGIEVPIEVEGVPAVPGW